MVTSGDNATRARLTLDSGVAGGLGLRNEVERLSLHPASPEEITTRYRAPEHSGGPLYPLTRPRMTGS